MKKAIDETYRRRKIQMEYNEEHGITPKTIIKDVRSIIEATTTENINTEYESLEEAVKADKENIDKLIEKYEEEMKAAAKALQFERAAEIRDIIYKLKKQKKKN